MDCAEWRPKQRETEDALVEEGDDCDIRLQQQLNEEKMKNKQ